MPFLCVPGPGPDCPRHLKLQCARSIPAWRHMCPCRLGHSFVGAVVWPDLVWCQLWETGVLSAGLPMQASHAGRDVVRLATPVAVELL